MLEISARIVAVIRWNPPRPRIPASMKSRVGRAVWRAKGLWPHWFESDGRSPGKAGLIVGSNDLACPNYTFASHARRKMGQSPRWRLPAKWNGELQGRPGCRRIPPVKRRSRQLEQLAVRLDEKSPTRGSARPPADIRSGGNGPDAT